MRAYAVPHNALHFRIQRISLRYGCHDLGMSALFVSSRLSLANFIAVRGVNRTHTCAEGRAEYLVYLLGCIELHLLGAMCLPV